MISHFIAHNSQITIHPPKHNIMKLIRKILQGVSLTAAMFVFQACYGTTQDDMPIGDACIHVVSADNGLPLENVKVYVDPAWLSWSYTNDDLYLVGRTDQFGILWTRCRFDMHTAQFRFVAEDSLYAVKDTVIQHISSGDTIQIALNKVNQ